MGKKRKRKYFGDIVLQQKIVEDDWRAFVHCQDSEGDWWELRAYGKTPEEAAANGWECYSKDEKQWDNYGYAVDPLNGLGSTI